MSAPTPAPLPHHDGKVSGTDGVAAALLAFADEDPLRPAFGDLTQEVGIAELLGRAAPLARWLGDAPAGPLELAPRSPLELAVGLVAGVAAGRPVRIVPRPGPRATATIEDAAPEGRPATWIADFAGIASRHEPSSVVLLATTSGSTADPRPVGVTSVGAFVLRPGAHVARHFAVATATATEFLHNLVRGGRVTLFELGARPLRTVVEHLVGAGVEVLQSTPSVLRRLAAVPSDGPLGRITLVTTSGEPLGWADVAAARRLTGGRATLVNRYGMSEAGTIAQFTVAPEVAIGTGIVPVGGALAGRTVHIGLEDGRLASEGGPGPVVVDGPFDRVVDPPLEVLPDGRCRIRTGDVGTLDGDGVLRLRGRADRMLKVRGMRIEPEVLEDLLRRLPGVADAVVVPSGGYGGEVRLVAHVVVDADGPTDAELRTGLVPHIPDVLLPARIVRHREPFPMLPGGKVDVRGLSDVKGG